MTPQMWASRMLRNLRANHAEQEDVVRTLGAAERLRSTNPNPNPDPNPNPNPNPN